MLIFSDINLVFFETPKTASIALHAALSPHADIVFGGPSNMRHFSPRRFQMKMLPMMMDHYWDTPPKTTAVIRNPIDWLGSWYRYRQRDELVRHPNSTRDMSFNSFANSYMSSEKQPFSNVGQQSKFLANADKNYPDDLWRFDALDTYCAYLSRKLNVEIELEKINVSNQYDISISAETMSALTDYFAKDFELYEGARS